MRRSCRSDLHPRPGTTVPGERTPLKGTAMTLFSRRGVAVLATAAFTIPAVLMAGGTAFADPTGTPAFRKLVGVGSDTTEEVMNALSEAIVVDPDGAGPEAAQKVLGSYNSTGGAFDAKDPAALPAGATSCNYAAFTPSPNNNGPGVRANGSSAGRARLLESLNVAAGTSAGDPRQRCLDFARSSSLNQNAATVNLTYIPFALDGLTYAVRGDSSISRQLTLADLKTIYQCGAGAAFLPLLPQAGSGTRSSWLSLIGLTEATVGGCVKDVYTDPADGIIKTVQEHDGRALVDKKMIVAYSAAQYSAQAVGAIEDRRGRAVLGGINGIPSQGPNPGGAGARLMYNVVPTARVTSSDPADALLKQVFVGPNAEVCKQPQVIARSGFGPITNCGDTSKTTN